MKGSFDFDGTLTETEMKRKEGRHPNPTVRHRSILSQPTTPSTGATMKTNRHNNTYTLTHTQTHTHRHTKADICLCFFLFLSGWRGTVDTPLERTELAKKKKESKKKKKEEEEEEEEEEEA